MDSEVARTLAELERKLQDLERALGAGSREHRPQETPAYEPPPASGDDGRVHGLRRAVGGRAPESASPAPGPPPAYAESQAPSTPSPPRHFEDSIDLVELARFRDRLEQTMRDLLADYERIIRLRSVSEDRGPVE